MGDDDCRHAVLIIEVVVELLEVSLSVVLLLDLLGFVVEVERVGASLQLLQKLVPSSPKGYLNSRGRCFGSLPLPAPPGPEGPFPVPGVFPVPNPAFCGTLLIQIK